jgi:hypothetical protein
MIKPNRISFGGTAAIVTSMALIAGLDAARAQKTTMVSALLIAAVADNLTDSLSVHMYQESQRIEQREVFFGTLANFATRLLVCLSFVGIVVICPDHHFGSGRIPLGSLSAECPDLFAGATAERQPVVGTGQASDGCAGGDLREPRDRALD